MAVQNDQKSETQSNGRTQQTQDANPPKTTPPLDWTRQQELKGSDTVTGPGETSVERAKILSAEECRECGSDEHEKYLAALGTIEERDQPGRA
jgi:hypothetical protein